MQYNSKLSAIICGVASAAALSAASSGAIAATKAPKPKTAVKAYTATAYTGPLLRPAYSPTPVLIYRLAAARAGSASGISAWVNGDGQGGTIRFRAFASNGTAGARTLEEAGTDSEPMWASWMSKPVVLNFTGWRKIYIPASELTYRPPASMADDGAPVAFSTADAVGFDTNRRAGKIFVSDIGFGESGSPSSTAGGAAPWRVHGTTDAVNAVQLQSGGTNPQSGNTSLLADFTETDYKTTQALSTLRASLGASDDPFVVFVQKSAFEPVSADALPLAGEAGNQVSTTMCCNQYQSASFTIYAKRALTNVIVTQKYPLSTIGHRLPATSVDINVVRFAKQHGNSLLRDADATGATGSMLLKDDRVAINMQGGVAPIVRQTGDAVTDIPAHTQKQFWLTIRVPADQQPGLYTGTLQITADGAAPVNVTLAVQVMPMRLLSPSKQYAINFLGKLGAPDSGLNQSMTDYLTPTQFQAQLKDIVDHGFRYTTLTDKGDDLWKSVDAYQQSGLGYPFLLAGFESTSEAESVNGHLPRTNASAYFLDDNVSTLPSDLADFKSHHMQSASIVNDADAFRAVGDNLDLVIYRPDNPYVQQLIASQGDRTSDKRDWLYWTSAEADPLKNRMYSGYLLWRANLYGAFASDYQTSFGADPFDDATPSPGRAAALRPQMLTYPCQNGVIDTVQWEAVRSGINDVRYLTTYFNAMRECKDNHVDKDLVSTSLTAVNAFMARSYRGMSDADLDAGRQMIAKYAVKLRTDVDAYYKTHAYN